MKGSHILTQAVMAAAGAEAGHIAAPASKCCQALASNPKLLGKVYYPDNKSYVERMSTYWSLSAALDPWCMVLPGTTDEVSAVLSTIIENCCPFGIRGGGHGTHALANSLEKGITIDLGHLNQVEYDEKKKIASIGPGGDWKGVYNKLSPYGVTVTGGRAGTVGVGGFLLGGGNSFHSTTHGFGCDNVINYEIVLADGKVVDVNENENKELWHALKGGSGNFGIVTRFDMQVIDLPPGNKIWGGVITYDYYKQAQNVFQKFISFAQNVERDIASSTILGWGYNSVADGYALRAIVDNIDNKANVTAFQGYLQTPDILNNTARSDTMTNLTYELGISERTYTIWFTGAFKADIRILQFVAKKQEEVISTLKEVIGLKSGMFTEIQAQPLTKPFIAAAKGNNVLGLEERVKDGPGFVMLIYFGVSNKEDEAKAFPYIKKFYEAVEEYAATINASWNWHYLNYASYNQGPIAAYGEESVKTLRAASKRYDPEGVFQNLRQSGFKIPE